jgi:IS30 family transposase
LTVRELIPLRSQTKCSTSPDAAMSRCRQLSIEERCSIARHHEYGQSIRQIAVALDRQPSTIARELKRNCGARLGCQPAYAQAHPDTRRSRGGGPARKVIGSSVTRRFTVSSMPNSSAPTAAAGAAPSRAPSTSAAGAPTADGCQRRSITFDNGTEFTRHHRIEQRLGLNAYFCNASASWQNRRRRKCLGFKTSAETFNPLHFKCESTTGSSPG